MRKSLIYIFFVSLILLFSSCSDTLNAKFPDASSYFALVSGVSNGTTTKTTTTSSSTPTTITTATVSGDFKNGKDYDVYYFYTYSGNKYVFTWENGIGTEVAVSVSDYSIFGGCHYSNSITSGISYTSDESDKLYIKVKPRLGYTSNAGSYTLTVKNGSIPVTLYKYDSYRY